MKTIGIYKYLLAGCTAVLPCLPGRAQGVPGRLAGDAVRVTNLQVGRAGDMLVVDMDWALDSLEMPTNTRFVFTPLVSGRGVERAMPKVVLNGRNQQLMYERKGHKGFDKNTVVVKRQNGKPQSVHYNAVLPYEDWMRNADFKVAEDLCGCGDLLDTTQVVLKRYRTPYLAYIRPETEARKERHEQGRAFLDFPVDKIELYPEYRKNPLELEKIVNTINLVKEDKNTTITGIEIHGFASPESPYEHNAYLAENRALTLKGYVCRLLALDDGIFTVRFTPEDWDGLRRYIEDSNLEHKAEILSIANDTALEPDAREWKIRTAYPEEYRFMLQQWYPALRHSDYVVHYKVRPFSVEEAKALLYVKPQQLSLEEMFMVAQTYEPGSDDFNEVFEIAVRMFPDDPTANLNAACTQLERKNYGGAEKYLAKAGDSPEAVHARGVVAMMKGDEALGRRLFSQAKEAGVEAAARNLELLDFE